MHGVVLRQPVDRQDCSEAEWVLTREQLLLLGLSQRQIEHRCESGSLLRASRGIYVVCGAPPSYGQRLLIATLQGGTDAVVSHRAAARMWKLPGFDEVVEISRTRQSRGRSHADHVHHVQELPSDHRTIVEGIPVTTLGRTLVDLGAVVDMQRVERALDTALARKAVSIEAIVKVHDQLAGRGRKGVAGMRKLLDARGDAYTPASELERRFKAFVKNYSIEAPDFEVRIGNRCQLIGRVDAVFRKQRLVVELDGRRWHVAQLDRENDHRRDLALAAEGWKVVRLTWRQVVDEPETTASMLRAILSHAA